jgi:surface polysaccharide O-acyltransferase-like enzyme
MVSEQTLRWTLVATGILHLAVGALALFAPGTFFDEIGRYGAENTHYVGDVGAFTAAAGLALLVAAARPDWRVPVLGLIAAWYALHALNHAFDTGEARSAARGWLNTALIGFGAVFAAYLAWVAARLQAPSR